MALKEPEYRYFRHKGQLHIHDGKAYGKDAVIKVAPRVDLCKQFPNNFEEVTSAAQIDAPGAPVAMQELAYTPQVVVKAPTAKLTKGGKAKKPKKVDAVAPDGTNVTSAFPKALEQDYSVYKHEGLYFVYDNDVLRAGKLVKVNPNGSSRAEVPAVIEENLVPPAGA